MNHDTYGTRTLCVYISQRKKGREGRAPLATSNQRPIRIMRTQTKDRKLVNAHLHHDGEHNDKLDADVKNGLYEMADGFIETPDYWDWSHIRDASDEAISRMARVIRVIRSDVYLNQHLN